ncbi:MAG: zf-HC2 domain-containing protein [bacterium]
MSHSVKHTDYLDRIPLLVAGTLSESSKADLLNHLQQCPECQKCFESEKALFELATEPGSEILFEDHPTGQTLDQYTFAPEGLSPAERVQITDHLETCELCQSICEKLRSLPEELGELISDAELPLINSMTYEQGKRSKPARILDIGHRFLWQPLPAYAAAAALLLIVILSQLPSQEGVPHLAARLTPHQRGQDSVAVFVSSADECILDLSYYLDPEAGHKYNLMIEPVSADKPSYRFEDYRDFDAKGNLDLRLLLTAGKYQLRILDIVDTDTVEVVQQFIIKSDGDRK